MNVIIHDLETETFQELFPNTNSDTHVISADEKLHHCIGCFGCWIKSPGSCVIKDGYQNMGEILSKANKLTIISQCCFGGYSPSVKNILDRSISYLLPFFRLIDKETHHKQRYKNTFSLSVYFYGKELSQKEMSTAQKLVQANCRNFDINDYKTAFFQSPSEICKKGEIQ
ncbi:MAG: flavodoxin family protein [Clostridiales bacterium]|nr:flavodoxin family protein [Clostridiales bacterium]